MIAAVRVAIVAAINAQGFTPAITAAAAYESTVELETTLKIGQARLLVIPREVENQDETFDGQLVDRALVFDVTLQYHAKTLATSELDPYLALAESIATYLLGESAVENAGRRCTDLKWLTGPWNAEHLERFKVLTIELSCTFTSIS